ncbi:MAG: 3-dehydroquinate synthase [Alphaproteobacteria bacterium]|nr:3-dehydroquinate synthase [Alphaproteobacteria bacterium]
MPTVVHSLAANTRAERTVRVELGARSYDVLIGPGLVDEVGRAVAAQSSKAKCAVVTDDNVAKLHLPGLEASLRAEGRFAGSIVVPAGEVSKSFSQLEPLCSQLLELGLERGDFVVAFGGGVIGDLAGFAAGIVRRGIRFVQVPTTLLAQVDSSVGGKTGINTAHGKNLIGVFHQPTLVAADTATLKTLPDRQMRAGYAEVAKYGLLGDAAFFKWLESNHAAIFAFDDDALGKAIETSVKAKADIVRRDELEHGDRALLNLGHTFGHAFEAWTRYTDRLLHGEAIAIGMCLAFRLSEELGHAPDGSAARVSAHFSAVGLPTQISNIPGAPPDVAMLLKLMRQDKKVRHGDLVLVLARDIGDAFLTSDVQTDVLETFLAAECGQA